MAERRSKLCLIVTGASRGLGKAMATCLCEKLPVDLAILVARSKIETAALSVPTHCIEADLANLDGLDDDLSRILEPVDATFDRLVFINNAGSLGHVGRAVDSPSLKELTGTVNFNITSAIWTSVRVARKNIGDTLIVNVSSLVAVQPFPSLAAYSAGKAARDAYHVSMADETHVKTLNYAPGPLEDTGMTSELRSADGLDETLKPHYHKELVDPNDSANALAGLIISGNFKSGQHVDYYDLGSPQSTTTN